MPFNVTIVTTANRIRRYTQTDRLCIQEVLDALHRSGQLFASRTLIIGSDRETEIFTPSAITRVEFAVDQNLDAYLPPGGRFQMRKIAEGETPETQISDTDFSGRVDFFFAGGDTVALLVSGPRTNDASGRLMNLTRLFEQAVLHYELPGGGIGLVNPANLTRIQISAGVEKLPAGSWQLEAL